MLCIAEHTKILLNETIVALKHYVINGCKSNYQTITTMTALVMYKINHEKQTKP